MIMSLRAGKYLLMNAVCAAVPMAMMAAMGCSGEPSLLATERDVRQNEDKQSEDKNGDGSQDVRPPQTGNGSHATVTAPGMKLAAYPPGPYGTKSGATIANEEFYGWRNPAAVAFDLGRAETIRLSDYYNAQAVPGQGVEYISCSTSSHLGVEFADPNIPT
jgi:hypothetical protein